MGRRNRPHIQTSLFQGVFRIASLVWALSFPGRLFFLSKVSFSYFDGGHVCLRLVSVRTAIGIIMGVIEP